MILKNPDKILSKPIITPDNNLWFVTDVSTIMDGDVTYEFKLVTQIPVKSSPNQQYYHMTRAIEHTATLKLHKMVDKYIKNGYSVYELYCNGQVLHGYVKDIDSVDKFIVVLKNLLPNY